MRPLILILITLPTICLAQEKASFEPVELEQRVRALKKPDVVWRKIPWKTCLIDAIHTSREEKKPIIAWIFIDRPKDDERC